MSVTHCIGQHMPTLALPHFTPDGRPPAEVFLCKGDIFLSAEGVYLKVVKDPKSTRSGYEIVVEPSTEAAYERRPIHKRLDHTVNAEEALLQKGRVMEHDGAWVHVKSVSRSQTRSAGMTSTRYTVHGPRIPTAEEAARKGKKWEQEQAVRDAALHARTQETLTY